VTEPFLFIVGRGRSGTTLLQAMVDSHPLVAIPPESHLVVRIARRRRRYERRGGFDAERFVGDLVSHYGFRRWDIPADDVRETLRRSPARSVPEATRALYGLYARRHEKTRYGDKTPINVMHLPLLARFLPEARFLHIIRDGRDVALSYLDQPFGAETVPEAAFRWRRDVFTGRRDGSRLGAGRYMEVRYEALVQEPESVLRRVCAFAGLAFDPAMLAYREHGERVLAPRIKPAHPHLGRPPTPGLRDWRRDMAPGDVAVFETLAGDLLSELGYERRFPRPSARVRLEAGVAVAGVHGRRVKWKLRRRRRHNRPPAPSTGQPIAD
jgi:hypothetical protein